MDQPILALKIIAEHTVVRQSQTFQNKANNYLNFDILFAPKISLLMSYFLIFNTRYTNILGLSTDFQCFKHDVQETTVKIVYDRKTDVTDCPALCDLLNSRTFDAVIDFSSYKRSELKRVLPHVINRTRLYIYISSDSVYEVCRIKSSNGDSKEEDDVRPESEEEKDKLKQQDKYGHDKLSCEEYLREVCAQHQAKFVCLRLADVIGPMDSTERWWQLQLWLSATLKTGSPLVLPEHLREKLLSFVFVKDIAKVVCELVQLAHSGNHSMQIMNQSYNLAFRERVTLHQLLLLINSDLPTKEEQVDVEYSTDAAAIPQYFPSVERGPFDVSKASQLLNWRPTSLVAAVRDTVLFYRDSVFYGRHCLDERRSVYESLCKDFKPFPNRSQLRKEVRNLLKIEK